jgi:hypothetical protein
MWTVCIVVDTPVLDLLSGVLERSELIDVQTLIVQPSIERLYVPVFSGLSGMREVEFHSPLIRPLLERPGDELRAVVHGDRQGCSFRPAATLPWSSTRSGDCDERSCRGWRPPR